MQRTAERTSQLHALPAQPCGSVPRLLIARSVLRPPPQPSRHAHRRLAEGFAYRGSLPIMTLVRAQAGYCAAGHSGQTASPPQGGTCTSLQTVRAPERAGASVKFGGMRLWESHLPCGVASPLWLDPQRDPLKPKRFALALVPRVRSDEAKVVLVNQLQHDHVDRQCSVPCAPGDHIPIPRLEPPRLVWDLQREPDP